MGAVGGGKLIKSAAEAPTGKVLLRGALWDATSTTIIEAGQAVVVRTVNNLVLEVVPAQQPVALDSVHA